MANIKKITIGSTTYDVEDTTARSAAAEKLPLAGGTLTGTLTTKAIVATDGYSYMAESDFNNSPPSGTTGQVLFVVKGV